MKKLLTLLLVAVLMMNTVHSVSAVSYNTDLGSIEMETYFSMNSDGTIQYDREAAVSDGINYGLVEAVGFQIDYMNSLVLAGRAYIDENYAAVEYILMTRAVGVNKIVTHWYGLTEIWMDSDKAADLVDNLYSMGDVISGNSFEAAMGAAGVSPVLALTTLAAAGVYIQAWAVAQAEAPGRGIVMYIQTDFVNQAQTYWFESQ